MRHKRIRFDHLRLNGVPVDVRYGDLLVAKDDCAELLDWEVVVSTSDVLDLAMSPYDVHIETHDARQLWGPGLLVRTDVCLSGAVEVELVCEPAFDYGRIPAAWTVEEPQANTPEASGGGQTLRLFTSQALGREGSAIRGRHVLSEGERAYCA